MGKFSKIKKYSKPSLTVDEKLDILNSELRKTGMLSEKMTTSTVYPDTETQPYIPPTYDLVPDSTGITGNSFSQPTNGGDENDSDTWADGWNSNAYLSNPDELDGVTNRSIVSYVPDSPYDDGGGGIVITGRYFGRSIGYLSGGNEYKQVLIGGLIGGTEQPTEDSRGIGGIYRGYTDAAFSHAVAFWNTYQSLVNEYGYNSIPTVTVKAWVRYNRFHDYQRGGEFADWTGGPKKTTADGDFILDTFAVVKVRSTDKYLSDPGQPRTAVLNRMDDPTSPYYHPGFIERALFGALDVGRRGLEYLRNKSQIAGYGLRPDGTQGPNKVGDTNKGHDGTIYQLVPRPGYGYNQWVPIKQAQANQDTQIAQLPPGPKGYESPSSYDPKRIVPIQSPGSNWGKTPSYDLIDPFKGLEPTGPGLSKQGNRDTQIAGLPVYGGEAELRRQELERIKRQMNLPPGVGWQGRFDQYGREYDTNTGKLLKQAKRKQSKSTIVAHHESEGQLISEGWQSPEHTYIEPNERKRWFNPSDIAPPYPTKPPNDGIFYGSSEEPPVTKKGEPHIKITEKDLIKNHRLKGSEVKEMMDTINALNAFLDAHPEELIHARKRYPKNDPRLAELNWKMDQMLSSSEEYMDTHFPENTRLFNRVQKSINRSIKLTDPRTYKDSKLPDTYHKLLSVDYVSGYGVEKKILKLGSKNKKSPARFLKKPRLKTKAQVLEDKLMQLETDLKKTGMGA